MNSIKDISDYIQKTVEDRLRNRVPVQMHWLTQEILANFSDFSGNDSDFYIICAKHYVTDRVKRYIGKFEPSAGGSQMTLDGFEYLQSAYPVERNGSRMLVPTEQCTYEELIARASELEVMGEGCFNHAKEIRGFADTIRAAA